MPLYRYPLPSAGVDNGSAALAAAVRALPPGPEQQPAGGAGPQPGGGGAQPGPARRRAGPARPDQHSKGWPRSTPIP